MSDKKEQIKEAIRQLHDGVPPEQVKEKFRAVFEGTDSLEIAKIEEELSKEGLKREDMRKLCDVHMAIFKEQIEKQNLNLKPSALPWKLCKMLLTFKSFKARNDC